jgi:hypothetical protein
VHVHSARNMPSYRARCFFLTMSPLSLAWQDARLRTTFPRVFAMFTVKRPWCWAEGGQGRGYPYTFVAVVDKQDRNQPLQHLAASTPNPAKRATCIVLARGDGPGDVRGHVRGGGVALAPDPRRD